MFLIDLAYKNQIDNTSHWLEGVPSFYVSNCAKDLACKNQIDNKSLARHGGYLFLKVQKIWHIRSNEIIVVID